MQALVVAKTTGDREDHRLMCGVTAVQKVARCTFFTWAALRAVYGRKPWEPSGIEFGCACERNLQLKAGRRCAKAVPPRFAANYV